MADEQSDEQLEMLKTGRKDWVSEAIWGCIGIAGGSLPVTFSSLRNAYWIDQPTTIDVLGLVQIILFFSSFFVAAALIAVGVKKGKSIDDLVDEIRKQKRA